MNEFDWVRGADGRVRQDIADWENKIEEWVRELFDDELERIYGTRIGDHLAVVANIAESAAAEPDSFRGVRDRKGRLQAAAIVRLQRDYLEIDYLSAAPWNVFPDRADRVKGAGTALMEGLVEESKEAGMGGKLKLYAIPRARGFYEKLGLEETAEGDWELTPAAAERFLERQKRLRGR